MRACGRRFRRAKAGKTGWRLLNRNAAFVFGRDCGPPPPSRRLLHPLLRTPPPWLSSAPGAFFLRRFRVGARASPLVAGPRCGCAWSEGGDAWGPAAAPARPHRRARPAAPGLRRPSVPRWPCGPSRRRGDPPAAHPRARAPSRSRGEKAPVPSLRTPHWRLSKPLFRVLTRTRLLILFFGTI